jgi:hypothetical protein
MPSHLRPRVRLGLRAAPDVCFQHVGSMTMVGNFWAAGAALAAHTPGARRYFGAVARCSDPRSFAPRPPHPPSRAPPSPPPSLACFGRRRERWRAFDSISLRSQPARAARLSRGRSSCCCFPPPYRPLRRCRTRAFDRLWGTRPSGTLWPLGAPSPLSRHSAFGHSVASGALGLRAFYGLSGHPLPSRGTRPLGIRSPLGHSAFGHSAASRGILFPLAALGLRALGRLWGTRPSGTLRPLGAFSSLSRHSAFGHSVASGALGLRALCGLSGHSLPSRGTRPSGIRSPLGHSAFGHSAASRGILSPIAALCGLSGHSLPSRGTRPLGIRSPLGHSAFGHSAASRGILSPLAALGLRAFGRLWGTRPSGTLRPLGALSPPLLASAIPPFATSPPTTGTGPRPRQTDDILPGDDNLCSATPRRPTKHLQDPQLSPSPLARSLARTGFRSDSSHSFTSRLSPAAHTALDSRLPQQLPPRMPSRASQSSPPPLLRSLS